MTAQGDLLSWVPYVKGSDTSKAAADSMQRASETIRADVLAFLKNGRATCEDVERCLSLKHQTASARIRELVLMGLVRDTGDRWKNETGRTARVYEWVG